MHAVCTFRPKDGAHASLCVRLGPGSSRIPLKRQLSDTLSTTLVCATRALKPPLLVCVPVVSHLGQEDMG